MTRYLDWAQFKEKLNTIESVPPYVSERDIWWASLGENVGSEINGKSSDFTRPVLVLRKLTNSFYLIAPCTTQAHEGNWYVPVRLGKVDNYICLNQVRTVDYRRLHSKLGQIGNTDFASVQRGFVELYV